MQKGKEQKLQENKGEIYIYQTEKMGRKNEEWTENFSNTFLLLLF